MNIHLDFITIYIIHVRAHNLNIQNFVFIYVTIVAHIFNIRKQSNLITVLWGYWNVACKSNHMLNNVHEFTM